MVVVDGCGLVLQFVAQFERLVVFRLGRLQDPKGPGTVVVLPCIDNWKPVDLRTKAFHVPPLQVITVNKGMVELGATVYYHIKDALAAINSVQDWNQATRTLAHTTIQRTLNKKQASDIEKKKREIGSELVDELNSATFAWGMEITEVELSDIKTIKEAENNAENVIKALSRPEVAGQIFSQFASGMGSSGFPGVPKAVEIDGDEVRTLDHALPVPNRPDGAVAIEMSDTSAASAPEADLAVNMDVDKLCYTLRSVLSPALVAEVGHKYLVRVTGRVRSSWTWRLAAGA